MAEHMEHIKTNVLRMSKTVFFKEMLKLYGAPWILVFLLILITAAVLSVIHDLRWIIVALMIVCITAPMMLAFFYIFHGMKPLTVINSLPHTLSFEDDGITATLLSQHKNEETNETEYTELSRRFLPYSEIRSYKSGVTSIILPFEKGDKGFIWLPVSAFDEENGLLDAMNKVISAIRNNKL